jgi:hypothetical protein
MEQGLDGAPAAKATGWNRPEWLLVLAPVALASGFAAIWLLLMASVGISKLMQG